MALAKELRKIGFSCLACETVEAPHKDTAYNIAPLWFLFNDPVFANFCRPLQGAAWCRRSSPAACLTKWRLKS